jgi:hypothetical protein
MTEPPDWLTTPITWSGEQYPPQIRDHIHALGVIAANYNTLEYALLCLFTHYLGPSGTSAANLFQQMRSNSFRLDTLKCAARARENETVTLGAVLTFIENFDICAENRNFLMHSQIDALAGRDATLVLAKATRKDPATLNYARLSLTEIRQVADDIHFTEQFGLDLFIYVASRRVGQRRPLPGRPPAPRRLNLSLHTAQQGETPRPQS